MYFTLLVEIAAWNGEGRVYRERRELRLRGEELRGTLNGHEWVCAMQYTRLNGAGPFACLGLRHKEEKEKRSQSPLAPAAAAVAEKAIVEMRQIDHHYY